MTLLRGTVTGDVRVVDGIVTEVGSLTARPGEPVEDLGGRLLLPAFAEPHIHLDKAFTWARTANLGGDLAGAMSGYSRVAASPSPEDIRTRALAALRLLLSAGATAVRCQVGCGPLSGITAIEALVEVREKVAGVVDLQIVAHAAVPPSGAGRAGGDDRAHRALLRRAVTAGADLIGGNPFLEASPEAALEACFEVAADLGVGVDLHVDETTDPSVLTLPDVAKYAREHPWPVTAAHCVSLGSQPIERAREIAGDIAAAEVSVVTLPATNLYLQGREDRRRGLTVIDVLREAGVTVAAGSDNVQDPFNPTGRCDPLETASLLVTAGHQEPSTALAMVSAEARALLGLPPAGLAPGMVADLVAIRADGPHDTIATASADRIVWRRGRVVARTEVSGETAI
ncbi:amidohydrolase family protein [Nonomuraea sp. NPDC050536]|uniref:amidohydrolase family protein n=1 Tax=Nonomuraea sp. NPDC050536 TaxID=3364366 RepID=UPI0037C5BD74